MHTQLPCDERKLQRRILDVSVLLKGVPPECPPFVSYRIITGLSELVAACKRAVILRACSGGTRVSASPLVMSTAGYFVPGRTCS